MKNKNNVKNLLIASILTMILTMGTALAAPSISVEPSTNSVKPGDNFTVNISMDPNGNSVYAGEFTLLFNTSILQVNEIISPLGVWGFTPGSFLSQDGTQTGIFINSSNNTKGTAQYAEFRTVATGVTNPGIMASISFHVKETAAVGMSSILNLSDVQFADPTPSILNTIVNNGSVNIAISTPPDVTNPVASHEIPDDTDHDPLWGEITQLNVTVTDADGITIVLVNLSEIGGPAAKPMNNIGGNIWSITTNASAGTPPKVYNLTVNATDTFGNSNNSVKIPLRVMKNGDATGNGVVNIGDALRIANNVSFPGNPAYALISPYVCEVTGNGIINIGDALRLANNVSFPGNLAFILK